MLLQEELKTMIQLKRETGDFELVPEGWKFEFKGSSPFVDSIIATQFLD